MSPAKPSNKLPPLILEIIHPLLAFVLVVHRIHSNGKQKPMCHSFIWWRFGAGAFWTTAHSKCHDTTHILQTTQSQHSSLYLTTIYLWSSLRFWSIFPHTDNVSLSFHLQSVSQCRRRCGETSTRISCFQRHHHLLYLLHLQKSWCLHTRLKDEGDGGGRASQTGRLQASSIPAHHVQKNVWEGRCARHTTPRPPRTHPTLEGTIW